MVQEIHLPFHESLQCFVERVEYDFVRRAGTIHVGHSSCTDMPGAIKMIERIDSGALFILVVNDEEMVVYARPDTKTQWKAGIFDKSVK